MKLQVTVIQNKGVTIEKYSRVAWVIIWHEGPGWLGFKKNRRESKKKKKRNVSLNFSVGGEGLWNFGVGQKNGLCWIFIGGSMGAVGQNFGVSDVGDVGP